MGPAWPFSPSGPSSPRGPGAPLSPWSRDWRYWRQVEILSTLIKYKWRKHDTEACDLWLLSLCLHWCPCHLWTQGSHLHPLIHWGEVACNESYLMINGIITLSFVQCPSSLKSQFDIRINGSPTFSPLLPFKPLTPSAPWEKVHKNQLNKIIPHKPLKGSSQLRKIPGCLYFQKHPISKQ